MKQAGLIAAFLCLGAQVALARIDAVISLSGEQFAGAGEFVGLTEPWKFRAGDDPAWAHPGFDDRAWETRDTRLRSGEWPGIGWFRLHLEVAPDLWGVPLALLYHQAGAAEVFVDGRLLYTFGIIGTAEVVEKLVHATDLDPLPLSLEGQSHHVIAVRYAHSQAAAYQRLGLDPGFVIHLTRWGAEVENLARKHAGFQMFFSGVPLAFGLLHLLLFCFYPRARENFYYALHTASIAATTFIVFELHIASSQEFLLFSRLSRIAIVLSSISVLLFVYSLFYSRLPRVFWGFLGAGAIVGTWSLYASIDYVYLFTLAGQAELLRVVLVALCRKKEGAWIIGLGALSFVLTVGYQILLLLEVIGHVGPFSYVYVYGILGLLISMSLFLARNVGRNRRELERQLGQVRELSSQLERKVEERTRELSAKNVALEDTLNQLRETQNQLIMQEKMASLGSLVAGVAHEINTPVGAIKSAADVAARCLARIVERIERGENLEAIRAEGPFQQAIKLLGDNNRVTMTASERVAKIVRSLRSFVRLDEAELLEADLHEGLESTLTLVQHELKRKVSVVREYGQVPPIYCYPNELNQVFMNLLINASQAIEERGTIAVRTFVRDAQVHIQIADTGTGISPEIIDRIFDPGVTTKGVGVGTGLGLSISYNIVRKHQGDLRVESRVGEGTTFTVILPMDLEKRVEHT